ncbi:MAG: hypothetical protein ACLQQ4_19165 [Bacteroidia bacterium]
MKKLIVTFGIILAGLFTVNAQQDSPKQSQTDKIMNEYTSVAQVTPDQAAKVRPMVESFLATRKENKEKYANDPDGLKAANKANRENLETQLKTVLSAEQVQKIKEYQKEKQEEKEKEQGK